MKYTLKDKMTYRFDNFMSKGSWSIFLALLVTFLIGFILLGIARFIAGFFIPQDVNTGLGIWRIFLQLTDPGNMAQDNESFWFVKPFAVVSGMFGIIFFSAVIAFITTQLEIKLEELKKGKSAVVEEDHTLILGWNSQIVEIIRELIIANESEKDACVVVMANEDKEEIDDFISDHVVERKTTRIITRSGETGSLSALERVTVSKAKSVIILPTCGNSADEQELAYSDAHTLKTTLAVIASCKNSKVPEIVVQVYNDSNRQIIHKLAKDKITNVDPEDMVAKIAVQTSRSTGLSAVYADLIGFDGCEFYFTKSDWSSILFKNIHYHFPDGIAIGIKDENGKIIVNPAPDYALKDDDEIIILAEDDSTIHFKNKTIFTPASFNFHKKKITKEKEKILIIGWNKKGKTIIEQYQDYIVEGSEINTIPIEKDCEMETVVSEFKQSTNNVLKTLDFNPYNIQDLIKLKPYEYDSIIILTSTKIDEERADANTINILLLLREVINEHSNNPNKKPQIITEVLNSDNLELISATGANDAIISTKMVSKVLAQIAEEPDVLAVYDEIFEEDGSEIYLKPLDLYLDQIPAEVQFGDLIHIAQSRNEICLGYRLKKQLNDVSKNFGIIINPDKNSVIKCDEIETVIVIAEDEL